MGRGVEEGLLIANRRETPTDPFALISDAWAKEFADAQRSKEVTRRTRSKKFRRRALAAAGVITAATAASVLISPAWATLVLGLTIKGGIAFAGDIKRYMEVDIVDPLPEDVAPWIGAQIKESEPLALEGDFPNTGQGGHASVMQTLGHITGLDTRLKDLRNKLSKKEEDKSWKKSEKVVTRKGEIVDYDYEKGKFTVRWKNGEEDLVSAYELFAEGQIPYDRIPQSLLSKAELKRIGNHLAWVQQESNEENLASEAAKEKMIERLDELRVHYEIKQTESGQRLEEEVRKLRESKGEDTRPEDYRLYNQRDDLWQKIYRILSA